MTITGIYQNGKVELSETPAAIGQASVLVTFPDSHDIDLRAYGISEAQAAELRASFAVFEDWNDPAMDVYNDYDTSKSALDAEL